MCQSSFNTKKGENLRLYLNVPNIHHADKSVRANVLGQEIIDRYMYCLIDRLIARKSDMDR